MADSSTADDVDNIIMHKLQSYITWLVRILKIELSYNPHEHLSYNPDEQLSYKFFKLYRHLHEIKDFTRYILNSLKNINDNTNYLSIKKYFIKTIVDYLNIPLENRNQHNPLESLNIPPDINRQIVLLILLFNKKNKNSIISIIEPLQKDVENFSKEIWNNGINNDVNEYVKPDTLNKQIEEILKQIDEIELIINNLISEIPTAIAEPTTPEASAHYVEPKKQFVYANATLINNETEDLAALEQRTKPSTILERASNFFKRKPKAVVVPESGGGKRKSKRKYTKKQKKSRRSRRTRK